VAFNGGKDNMLLLHLLILYLQSRGRSIAGFNSIYFVHDDDFEEVQHFVEKTASEYVVDLFILVSVAGDSRHCSHA
jgi:predicted phosphoadenosine phosphosulfate sulfurtransferase